MIYLCCDTNIYVRILTQSRPGCEPEHFDDLKALVQGNLARLLVPELVLLELQKHRSVFPSLFAKRFEEFKKVAVPKNLWNEIEDVGKAVLDLLDQKLEEKTSRFTERYPALYDWLTSSETTIIPFTPEIHFQAKRRLISGQMPQLEKKAENDACIVESLGSFFTINGVADHVLYFCTENYSDFAIELPVDTKARRRVFHPIIQSGLPPTSVFGDLASLMYFAKGYESFPEPTPEEIAEAAKAFEATHRSEDEEKSLRHILETANRAGLDLALVQATLHHMEAQPEYVRSAWETLIDEVTSLLRQCRECRSWDDRSELKLYQWLELETPKLIPFASLPKLARIRSNLQTYLEIHREMDRKLESGGSVAGT